MREPLVELLVEVIGLPVQVGRFRRIGVFDLELVVPLVWLAESDGHNAGAWAGPTDWAWRLPGDLRIASWRVGDTVTLDTMTLHVEMTLPKRTSAG